jgi:PhnB protein
MTATATKMLQPIPYLGFDGNCAEAMRFYEALFGGTIETMVRNADTPMADQFPAEDADRIMNCQLRLPGGAWLYGGDRMTGMAPFEGIKGVSITLNFDDVAEAGRVYQALADGGQVLMPLAPTFWAKSFAMLVDKFGAPWTINGELLSL